jgi:hypothetical protein
MNTATTFAAYTIVLIAVGVSIGYVTDFLLKVIKTYGPARISIAKREVEKALQDAYEVINAYSKYIEDNRPDNITDAKELPYPKDMIKVSFQLALLIDKTKKREALAASYLLLANFQPGVCDMEISLDDVADPDLVGMQPDIFRALAKRLAKTSGEFLKWNELIEDERAMMKEDLRLID